MANIMKVVKENEHRLVHFDGIMKEALQDCEYPQFVALTSLSDFTDGFMVAKASFSGPRALRSFLTGFELDALMPRPSRRKGRYFVQLESGPFDIRMCLDNLVEAASKVRFDALASQSDN